MKHCKYCNLYSGGAQAAGAGAPLSELQAEEGKDDKKNPAPSNPTPNLW